MTLGFIGTGTITEAIVRGLKASSPAGRAIVVSPRGAEVAARLAALPGVRVAADNQAVVDAAKILVLAVRPQVAEEVLSGLTIPAETKVLSLIAGFDHERLARLTGARTIIRAVPLPFVAERRDATPVFPPDPEVMALFDALGQAIPVATRKEFDLLATLSALMGSFFGIAEIAETWAAGEGLASARPYLGRLFANLGQVMAESPESLSALREGHSTKGGLNEQVFARFTAAGGDQALTGALASVLARVEGR